MEPEQLWGFAPVIPTPEQRCPPSCPIPDQIRIPSSPSSLRRTKLKRSPSVGDGVGDAVPVPKSQWRLLRSGVFLASWPWTRWCWWRFVCVCSMLLSLYLLRFSVAHHHLVAALVKRDWLRNFRRRRRPLGGEGQLQRLGGWGWSDRLWDYLPR